MTKILNGWKFVGMNRDRGERSLFECTTAWSVAVPLKGDDPGSILSFTHQVQVFDC